MARYRSKEPRENFQMKHVFASFKTIPRIAGLVWAASPQVTFGAAVLCIAQGVTPALSATITQLLFDGVLQGIRQHSIAPIWLPVCLQLGVNLFNRVCLVVSLAFQGLLRDRVSDHVQVSVLSKANTLDMAQFENSEYYDTLRHAIEEAAYRPSSMITQTFDLVRTFITLCSMLFLIAHLSWWLVIVALIIPIPSFISNSRYGWREYVVARRQSPERRMQNYHTQMLTVDQYVKEIRLFNLGDFVLGRFKHNAEKLYEENKQNLIRRATNGLLWSILTIIANSGIYLYIALQAVLGRITFGQLSKYVTAANSAGQSFQSVLDGFTDTYENSLFVNQLFEFLEYEPKIVSPAQVITAANMSGADKAIAQLSNGYDAMLGRWFEKGVELSGGQWQKIALARAFMRNAPILILDEPTSALDAQAEYDIFTRFRSLTEGKTAIFISHRFSTVRLANRIFVVEQGIISESGSYAELMSLNGRYAELFNLQAKAYH